MAKKTPIRPATRPTGRELVLAGIGAVSLARKQARASLQAAALRANQLRQAATAEGDRVRALVQARAVASRAALAPALARLQQRAGELAAQVPAGLRPLLERVVPAGPVAPAKRGRTAPRRAATTKKAASRQRAA